MPATLAIIEHVVMKAKLARLSPLCDRRVLAAVGWAAGRDEGPELMTGSTLRAGGAAVIGVPGRGAGVGAALDWIWRAGLRWGRGGGAMDSGAIGGVGMVGGAAGPAGGDIEAAGAAEPAGTVLLDSKWDNKSHGVRNDDGW